MDIKFMAWDKKGKGFINGFNMIGFSNGQGAPKKKLQRFSDEWNEEDFILMQYTGKKDDQKTEKYPEGKEIYRGDIVKWTSLNFEGEAVGEVTFFEGCWFIQGDYNNGRLYDCLKVEVIGNIYEVIGSIIELPPRTKKNSIQYENPKLKD